MLTIASSSTQLVALGAFGTALAVAFGAFGAHGLRNHIREEKRLKAWETAAHYHLLHGVGVIACGILQRQSALRAGELLTIGTTLFSGSIYALVLLDMPKLGIITPIGGLTLIAGWLYLGFAMMNNWP